MPRPTSRPIAFLLAIALLLAPATFPYEVPLESHSIRDAYFLGQRSDEKLAHFLETYTKHLPVPKAGAYISQITLLTPYALVVDTSHQKTQGYSAQQAELEYKQRGDIVRVYVHIEFTATYGFLQATDSAKHVANEQNLSFQVEDFWRDFGYVLSQDEALASQRDSDSNASDSTDKESGKDRKMIRARYADATPLYGNGEYGGGLQGTVVALDYDAQDVASAPATFEVITSAGEHISATFDLSKLR